jgi:conjugative relaxase-like TrwC/TraI family protein
MFNCANVAAGQASSYYKLDDYYHEKGRVPARVMGAAAERLGLAGEFDSTKFNSALAGEFNSNIESANKPNAQRAGYDCVFSAPKSVSIEALVYGHMDVVEAHKQAVEVAMKEVQNLVRARVTNEFKTTFEKADIVYFEFLHETSRNVSGELPDPDLHTHNVILKQVLVKDENGNEKLYALSNDEIFKAQKMLDAIYKQQLSSNLKQLGYAIELTKDGFEIAGYQREDILKLSKRTQQVDANLADKGLTRENSSSAQRDIAALKNRNSKKTFSREEMRKSWKDQTKDIQRPIRKAPPKEIEIQVKTPDLSHLTQTQLNQGIQNVINRSQHDRPPSHILRREIAARSARYERDAAEGEAAPDHEQLHTEQHTPGNDAQETSGLHELPASGLDGIGQVSRVLLQDAVYGGVGDKQAGQNNDLRRTGASKIGSGEEGEQIKIRTADEAVAQAIAHFAERDVKIGNAYVLAEFAIKNAEFKLDIREIREAIDDAIESGELVLGRNKEVLVIGAAHRNEVAITNQYLAGQGTVTQAATQAQADAVIKGTELKMTEREIADREAKLGRPLFPNEIKDAQIKLKAKQVAMIQKIATSTDRFNVIVGDAGTGKSTGMEAAKQILESQGFKVKGLAPSGGAVEALEKSGLETKTVQHAFSSSKYWEDVTDKTIIILDEAGLVDAKTMLLLQVRATERGARIAIVGDFKQYGSVERGAALKQLAELSKKTGALVNLDEMQRGRNDEMRELHFAARDKPEASLDMMFQKGMVTAIADDKERLDTIAEMYVSMDSRDVKNALVITGKNVDRVQINEAIRAKLNLSGGEKITSLEMIDATAAQTKMTATYERGDFIKLNQKSGDWKAGTMLQVVDKTPDGLIVKDHEGTETTLHPRDFKGTVSIGQTEQIDIAVGDRVRFTAADKTQQVINGERGTVTKVENGKAFIELDSGKQASVSLDKDATVQLRYAFSQTGHSAQGATAKMFDQQGIKPNVILCTNANDATVDAKSWYTNLTRAADKVHMVTNADTARQIESIRKAITHSKEKDMAEELLNGKTDVEVKKEDRAAYIAPAAGDQAWQRIELPFKAKTSEILEILQTAQAQYGRELFVSGPVKFQNAVAKIAGRGEIDIKFDDKELDKTRKAATREGLIAGLKKAIEKAEPGTIEKTNMVLKLIQLNPKHPLHSPIQPAREAGAPEAQKPKAHAMPDSFVEKTPEAETLKVDQEAAALTDIHKQISEAQLEAHEHSFLRRATPTLATEEDYSTASTGHTVGSNEQFVAVYKGQGVTVFKTPELAKRMAAYDGIAKGHDRFAKGNKLEIKKMNNGSVKAVIREEREEMQNEKKKQRELEKTRGI